MSKRLDITGMKYGRLTAIERDNSRKGKSYWLCKCDCGNFKYVYLNDLKNGKIKSCGCFHKEVLAKKGSLRKTHGMTNTRIYHIWTSMKQRCLNKNSYQYKNYGGRGITVCKEWKDSFEVFYEWSMANGYTDELTIDRIDVNGNYCPENCRWATYKEQGNNRRKNFILELNGEKKTLAEWSRIIGISSETLKNRILSGWKNEEFFLEPNLSNSKIRREQYGIK